MNARKTRRLDVADMLRPFPIAVGNAIRGSDVPTSRSIQRVAKKSLYARPEGNIVTAASARQFSWPRELKHSVAAALPRWVRNWREAQYYLRYGEIELHFLDLLCSRDRESIDVGAHDGCYVHFLRKFSRHVYAFEPIPWLAAELVKKFPQNVSVHAEALSRSDGTAILHMPVVDGHFVPGCSTVSETASSAYGASKDIAVPIRTLDGVYSGDVGFMKIDVEGHEIEVIEGGCATIERCRPTLVIEIVEHLSPDGVVKITEFLRARGYAGHFFYRWKLLPVGSFDAATMQRAEDYPDLTASLDARERAPRFVYNFIYLPSERAGRLLPALQERVAQL
jgi:FkbM family methyltransferase